MANSTLRASGITVGAGATHTTPSVDCKGSEYLGLYYDIDQTNDRSIQVSDDEVTWYTLQTGGLNASGVSATGATSGSKAITFAVAGFHFIRARITNTGAVSATLRISIYPMGRQR